MLCCKFASIKIVFVSVLLLKSEFCKFAHMKFDLFILQFLNLHSFISAYMNKVSVRSQSSKLELLSSAWTKLVFFKIQLEKFVLLQMAPFKKAEERFFPEKFWLFKSSLKVRFSIRNLLNSFIFSVLRSSIPLLFKLLIK